MISRRRPESQHQVRKREALTVQQGQVHLLVNARQGRVHKDIALSLASLPDIGQVVDTLAPLVDKQGRGLRVRRLDPCREQVTLVSFVPQELVEVSIRDLLDGLNVVDRDELVVSVEELDTSLLEGTLSKKQTLDTGQAVVRVVVRLLDQGQLFTLRLIETTLNTVGLLELLKGENKKLGVVLVGQGREGDRSELATLKPVNGRPVDGHTVLWQDVGTVLQVAVLTLLLGLQVQTSQSSKVLARHRLVNCGPSLKSLSVAKSSAVHPELCRLTNALHLSTSLPSI